MEPMLGIPECARKHTLLLENDLISNVLTINRQFSCFKLEKRPGLDLHSGLNSESQNLHVSVNSIMRR